MNMPRAFKLKPGYWLRRLANDFTRDWRIADWLKDDAHRCPDHPDQQPYADIRRKRAFCSVREFDRQGVYGLCPWQMNIPPDVWDHPDFVISHPKTTGPDMPEPKLQAIINATPAQLDLIRDTIGVRYELCHTSDNGTVIYEDSGPAVLAELAKHQRLQNNAVPQWDTLPQQTRTGLLQLAADCPQWNTCGELDDYRIEQFLQEYPGVLTTA